VSTLIPTNLDLTLKDRVLLANQYRILEKLYPSEADYYRNIVEVRESGYTFDYHLLTEHFSPCLTAEECREIRDILEMHRMIHNALQDTTDRSGIDPDRITFKGFDLNNEGRYFGTPSFFCMLRGGGLNLTAMI
jgi:uncharacterized protein YfbU (UPF0304 family)